MKSSRDRLRALGAVVTEAESGKDNVRSISSWTRYLLTEEMERKSSQMADVALVHEKIPQWGSAVREMFGNLYDSALDDPLETPETDAPKWVGEYVGALANDAKWNELRKNVRQNEIMTGMACKVVTDATYDLVKQHAPKEDEKKLRRELDALQSLEALQKSKGKTVSKKLRDSLADIADRVAHAEVSAEVAANAMRANAGAIRQAVSSKLSVLERDIEEASEAMESLGFGRLGRPGRGVGTPEMMLSEPPDQIIQLVKRNPMVKKVAQIAGRLREAAAERRMTRTQATRGEVSSTTTGDDISKLLPSEMVYASDDEAEWLLFRRILERAAQQYDVIGHECVKQGPIVILIDESGSMQGVPIAWAKAVAVTMMGIASEQRRAFAVLGFCEGIVRSHKFDPAKGVDASKLMEAICGFANGGTDIALALDGGIKVIQSDQTFTKADLILISDGADDSRRAPFLAKMKETGIALHSVFINADGPPDLQKASDHYVRVNSTNIDEAQERVSVLFDIGRAKESVIDV